MNRKITTMTAIRPHGSTEIITSNGSGMEPMFVSHYYSDYYSRSLEREITEEGRRRLTINDPIKPTHNIKSHKI